MVFRLAFKCLVIEGGSHSITPFLYFIFVAGDLPRKMLSNTIDVNETLNPDLKSFAPFLETHDRYIRKSVPGTLLEAQKNDADSYHLI
jgi:hypothetical protein